MLNPWPRNLSIGLSQDYGGIPPRNRGNVLGRFWPPVESAPHKRGRLKPGYLLAAALSLWRPLVDKGNAVAQYHVALLYRLGKGVPRDEPEGMTWMQKSAEGGYPPAQYVIANSVLQPVDSVPRYRKAADQGHAAAQYKLAMLYDLGVAT